jgi:hypothetical protein
VSGEARVEVRDLGIGISEENQKRIFQQFERVSASQVAAGLGLGLFISEQIVAAHGGTIEVESRIGEGACFGVPAPVGVKSIVPDATSDDPMVVLQQLTEQRLPMSEDAQDVVLIVEDDESIMLVLGDYLSGLGYRVLQAENGSRLRNPREQAAPGPDGH